MKDHQVVVLIVDDNVEFVKGIEDILHSDEQTKFFVIWKNNGDEAVKELEKNPEIDVILMEYFLPGKNGLEVSRLLGQKKIRKPTILITVNKDFELAVEVMKHGVAEYLVKDELAPHILLKTIQNVLKKQRLREELMALEVTKNRLEAMRDLVGGILKEITEPVVDMEKMVNQWISMSDIEHYLKFLVIARENIARITKKIEQLRTLNKDKTVKYIKDIRMIDLS